jgi:ribosomal protein S27AE
MNGPSNRQTAADVYRTPDGSSAAGSVNRSAATPVTNIPDAPVAPAAAEPVASDDRDEWEQAQLVVAAHRICPGCGTAMVDRSCKLRCLRCGFFLDCSDG